MTLRTSRQNNNLFATLGTYKKRPIKILYDEVGWLFTLCARPSQPNRNFTTRLAGECKVLDVHPVH
jgi:hypothetical protein